MRPEGKRNALNKKLPDRITYHFSKRSMKQVASDVPNHMGRNHTWSPTASECNPCWRWNCSIDKRTWGELSCFRDVHRSNNVELWFSEGSHLNWVLNYCLSWLRAGNPVDPLHLFPSTCINGQLTVMGTHEPFFVVFIATTKIWKYHHWLSHAP